MSAEQNDQLVLGGAPFTTTEAEGAGLSRAELRRLVKSGAVRRVVRRVWVDSAIEDSVELRSEAVAKVAPDDAIVCRRTAAWLYGIDAYALQEADQVPPIETVRRPLRRSIRHQSATGHAQTILDGDVVERHGLLVTSPVATAVHLARHLERPFALSAIDAMCHAGLVAPLDLVEAVRRYPHHPGIVQAREIVALAEPLTESPGESWLRLRLVDAGLGRPVPQVCIADGGREHRVDLAYLDPQPGTGRRLALEYDSDLWHSSLDQRTADMKRRSRLSRIGWDVLPVRREEVWGFDPALEIEVGRRLGIEPQLPRRW